MQKIGGKRQAKKTNRKPYAELNFVCTRMNKKAIEAKMKQAKQRLEGHEVKQRQKPDT